MLTDFVGEKYKCLCHDFYSIISKGTPMNFQLFVLCLVFKRRTNLMEKAQVWRLRLFSCHSTQLMTWANDPTATFLGCVHTKEPLMEKPEFARYCIKKGMAHCSIFLLPTHLYLHIWNCGLRRMQTSEEGVHSQPGRETHKSSKETKLCVREAS